MKKKINKIKVLINPKDAVKALRARADSLIVKYSYIFKSRLAPFPKGVVFVINESCNARCKMCDVGTKNQTHVNRNAVQEDDRFLPLEDFKKVVDSVLSKKPDIWFMATEPLLYPHFLEAAEYTIRKGLRFQFTTNGILLPRYALNIVRLKINRILLSFTGGDATVHDKIIEVEGAFNKSIEGIELINDAKKRLNQTHPSIFINFVITNENYRQLYEHIELLSRLDVDKITISNTQFVTKEMVCAHKAIAADDSVTESSVFNFNPIQMDTRLLFQQIQKVFTELANLNIALAPNIKDFYQLERYYKQPMEFIRGYEVCYYPWRFAHILPNGDVIVSWRCFSKPFGNVKKKAFPEIWNGSELQKFRVIIAQNKGHYPTCARCGFLWCSYNM